MTKLAAGHAGGKAIIADGDLFVHVLVGEVVSALGHSAHKDTYTFARLEVCNKIPGTDDLRLETQGDLPTIWRQVVGDRILDYTQELLLGVGRSDGEAV